jgi:hypothetical protein
VVESATNEKRYTINIPNSIGPEGRSVAQVCEAFLKAGSESYKKKGSDFVKRFLAESQSRPKDA